MAVDSRVSLLLVTMVFSCGVNQLAVAESLEGLDKVLEVPHRGVLAMRELLCGLATQHLKRKLEPC